MTFFDFIEDGNLTDEFWSFAPSGLGGARTFAKKIRLLFQKSHFNSSKGYGFLW